MSTLALQKCLNHASREAVARCPECAQSYCRECVVEHEDRVLCTPCLAKAARKRSSAQSFLLRALGMARFAAAFFFLWLCFFGLGKALLAIPSSFHEGAIWKSKETP